MPPPDRIDNLETVVRALRDEVAELRSELRRLRGDAPVPDDRRWVPGARGETIGSNGGMRASGTTELADAGQLVAAPGTSSSAGGPPRSQDTGGATGFQHRGDAGPTEPPHRPAGALAGGFAGARPAAAAGSRSALESLVGRYGTLALGALALVMALGAWLSWAIENYKLSDAARVALGAVGAGSVGVLGFWLRRRGTIRFGNVMLGIALALVQVDAWGAGPVLRVVPTGVALAVAALASAALAVLAYRSSDESLFAVGIGGALAAPFVTTDGTGSTVLLLLYGWLVLGSAIYALRGRPWRTASWLVVGGTLVYAVVGAVRDPAAGAPWYQRDAPLFFALNVAVAAWAAEYGARRGVLARLLLYVVLVPAIIYHDQPATRVDRIALTFAATILAYLSLRDVYADRRALLDRLTLPLLFLSAALAGVLQLHEPPTAIGAGVALLWAGAALLQPIVGGSTHAERGVDLAVLGVASAVSLPLALEVDGVAAPTALAVHAGLFCFVVRRERRLVVALPVVLALVVAATWSYFLLETRPHYAYVPFATRASLAAAATVGACTVLSWLFAPRAVGESLGIGEREGMAIGAIAPIAAFAWGDQELAHAVSPSVASFALIAYWAACGVLAILVGRWRAIAAARQAGLAVSIIAALRAVGQASSQPAVGLRIGSYLVVAVFLLAVAYWYRAAGGDRIAPSDDPRPA